MKKSVPPATSPSEIDEGLEVGCGKKEKKNCRGGRLRLGPMGLGGEIERRERDRHFISFSFFRVKQFSRLFSGNRLNLWKSLIWLTL